MRWMSKCCEHNHKAYRNYVAFKPLPFDSSILSKELVKVKSARLALVVCAGYKSKMTGPSMQEGIAPRDRIHKSDGRQPLTNGRRFVILSAKRKPRWFLDSQNKNKS